MPLFSRLQNNDTVGAFTYNLADVIFPLEYHDLFQWSLDLLGLLGETYSWQPSEAPYFRIDPGIFQLFISLVSDVLYRLARASYGGNCLPGTLDLRDGALAELGTNAPPLYHFIRLFRDHQPFTAGSIIDANKFEEWTEWFQDAVDGTKEWIIDARLRAAATQPNGWNWGPATFNRDIIDTLGYDPRDPYFPMGTHPEPSLALIPHPVVGRGAQNSLIPYRPLSVRLQDTPAPRCTDLIPHPTLGPGAQNALVVYQPPVTITPNMCTDLIPHPVLGPGAQNTLVAYHPSRAIDESFERTHLSAYEDPKCYEVIYAVEPDETASVHECFDEQYLAQGFSEDGRFEVKKETSD
ncbi:hypothetical protein LXA43DRAFT_1102769 [Ganoderma leucocontextum]|nr:hypothetical protein LXA43DRAFT_1102769 [Ganoderma leucocontextum]